jgi:predicted P-loop ATPase
VDNWLSKMRTSDAGNPKAVIANAVTAFREAPEWRDILFFDEFTNRVVIRGQAPWMKSATEIHWRDHFDVEAATWLQHRDIDVTPTMVAQAVDLAARDNSFHPVREYLESLVWDRNSRLDQWLTYYLGAEPDVMDEGSEISEAQRLFYGQSSYLKAIGRLWLISAVARIFLPGCKADCALILEGPQGKRKSTAINTLANPWFADELSEFGSKESAILIAGVWIVELAELSALHRSDIERAKSYISRKTDHYRPVWGRRWIDQPRQCVFAGTTNSHEYLNDPTGARRWWPVKCGNIDIETLAADRDQLWAEAVVAFRNGEKWHLEDEGIIRAAAREQEARAKTDIWDDHIRRFLADQMRQAEFSGRKVYVTKSDVLREIGILERDQTQVHANRVADCFVRFGWERFRIGSGALRGTWAYRLKLGTTGETGNEND